LGSFLKSKYFKIREKDPYCWKYFKSVPIPIFCNWRIIELSC
jgi:hypothetical protein